jgi:hypothetical protein
MFSRSGALAIAAGSFRRERVVHRVSMLSSAVCFGAAGVTTLYHCNTTKLDGDHKFEKSASLVVPTIEAAARALRLVSTAILIVTDYEFDKVASKLFPASDPQRIYWEEEKRRRQRELEEAQIAYTSPKPNDMVEKSGMTRQEFVMAQKESVHRASERLAETEGELSALGGKGSVHYKAANRLLRLCHKNGGVYIKIGQHLANLDYLIPEEYIEVLSSLFNEAPQSCESWTVGNVCFVTFDSHAFSSSLF